MCDSKSRLTKYLNVSGVHAVEVEAVRDGSHSHQAAAAVAAAGVESKESEGVEDEVFTIAMTTCRRLNHFISVARNVNDIVFSYSHIFVIEILVVDDGSSLEDREAMLRTFPSFVFVFKSEQSRGHASSLNMIMRHVDTRFFLYLEDDWQLLRDPVLSSVLRAATVSPPPPTPQLLLQELIRLSIHVIQDSLRYRNASYVHEPVAQVFLNDQRQRRCALGKVHVDTDTCEGRMFCRHCDVKDIGRGGWRREAVPGPGPASASVPGARGEAELEKAVTIPYSLHEFGVLYEVRE